MRFSQLLKESLQDRHLLNHPFYQDWMAGKLSRDTLKEYAAQYYHHVSAFPRYISATHSLCENIENRKILLENLMDEEGARGDHHPELWLRFAEGVGQNRDAVMAKKPMPATTQLVSTFHAASRSSYEEGLAAIYAYEYQIPEVANSKIEGLKSNYSISDDRTLAFFEVHKEADIYHREACEKLLDGFTPEKQKAALVSAKNAADALWNFLTEVHEYGKERAA